MAALEFQMTTSLVQDIFERQIKPYLTNTCTGWALGDYLVDHVELGGSLRLENRPASVEAATPLVVCLVTRQALEASINQVPALQRVKIEALFDITINGLLLTVGFRDVKSSALEQMAPAPLLPTLKTTIRNFLSQLSFSLDLGAQIASVDPQQALSITAAAIATDGAVLTVRFEVAHTEEGNPGAALQARPLPVRLAGQEVAVWIEGAALEYIARAMVSRSVNEGLKGEIVDVRWLPTESTPRVRIVIKKVLPVPDPFSATAVVTADASLGMAPYGVVGGGSVLQLAVAWDWTIEGDFVTEAVVALLKPLVQISPDRENLPECAVPTGDQSFVCDQTVPAANFGPARLTFGRVSVVDNGVTLAGLAHLQPLPTLYPLAVSRRDWFVGYIATCTGRANDPTDQNRVIYADASFTIHEPGRVCNIAPVGIPDDIVSRFVSVPAPQATPYTVTVMIPENALRKVLENYAGDFRFQVVTSRGIRMVSLGRPPVSFAEDGRVQNPDVTYIDDCHWEQLDPWARVFHVFNPKWHIDPSPAVWRQFMASAPVMEAISIHASGISTPLQLTTEGFGQQANSLLGNTRFAASFLLPATARKATARLSQVEATGNGAPPSDVVTENVLLQRVTALSLDEPISGFAVDVFRDQPVLAVGLPERASLYALEDLAETQLLAEFGMPSARGFASMHALILAYGEIGLVAFDGNETNAWIETPVMSARRLPSSALIAALTGNGILVLEPDGYEVNFVEAPDALGMLVVGQKLVLASPDGLRSFWIDGVQLTSMAFTGLEGIRAISATPAAFADRVIAVTLEDQSARLVEVLDTGEIELLAEMDATPWFARVAMNEKAAVLPGSTTQGLVLYQVSY